MRILVLAIILAHASAPAAATGNALSSSGNTVPVEAIGRLVVDGKFLCTAFPVRTQVIPADPGSNNGATHRNWLVTAGHCLGNQMVYRQPMIRVTSPHGLVVYPERTHPVFPLGFSGRPPEGFDIAVLEYTSSYPAPFLEPAFDSQLNGGDSLLAAGFSRGVLYVVVGRFLGRNADGQLIVDALLSRGSSGGPVLIPGTRRVVGIIVEGTPKRRDERPYACVFTACETDRPFKAAPINWILQIIRW